MTRARIAALVFLALVLVAPQARANELIVEPRTVQTNDLVTITVSLEGEFATADSVTIPLRNLVLLGDPSVSSEFAWINGDAQRRKSFRYRARPLAAGPAQVGPIVLTTPDGQRDTLAAVAVQVEADRASGSNDAEVVLRELQAEGREPLFVIAEADKRALYVGEPVTVTWWLYNAAAIQQWQIASVPKLPDFWTEERGRSDTPERVYVGDALMQRIAIRRATLFPLQSGSLSIGGTSVEAAVMRPVRRGPFAMFEGEMVETTFTSAPVQLDVKPIPPGPAVDAIGDIALTCDAPMQKNGGPVVVQATLTGVANLRAATPPRFEKPVEGTVQIEGGEVTVTRDDAAFAMRRQWRYLVFPSASAPLEIPSLTMTVFVPSTGQRRELRCVSTFVNAVTTRPPEPIRDTPKPAERPRLRWPWIAGFAALALAMAIAFPRVRRELAVRREARAIARNATPAEVLATMEQRVRIDAGEQSDRADAWRALRSLLDAAMRDREMGVDMEEEIEARVREVLRMG